MGRIAIQYGPIRPILLILKDLGVIAAESVVHSCEKAKFFTGGISKYRRNGRITVFWPDTGALVKTGYGQISTRYLRPDIRPDNRAGGSAGETSVLTLG